MVLRPTHPDQSGLPVRNPTSSYWHTEPSQTLLNHRTTPTLPQHADVVIVGSGITGAFAAHFLLNQHDSLLRPHSDLPAVKPKVVMLEAREACWGATGRNGGHCQPHVFSNDAPTALFELANLSFLRSFVKRNGIECDFRVLPEGGVAELIGPEALELARSRVEKLRERHPELAALVSVHGVEDEEVLRELRVRKRSLDGGGVVVQRWAASLWPYKLVAGVLEGLVEGYRDLGGGEDVEGERKRGVFNLQTNTAVTGVRKVRSGESEMAMWEVRTPRGRIFAKQVLLATNGYTSHLLPAFADLIVPVRGQVAALVPPAGPGLGSHPVELDSSYIVAGPSTRHREGESQRGRSEYLVQRPPESKGLLIFGGGRDQAPRMEVGEWRDDSIDQDIARYLRRTLPKMVDLRPDTTKSSGASRESEGEAGQDKHELKAHMEWTGIMGYSRDGRPWVGEVPPSLGGADGGLFVCAGYTGHGMPAAALCARDVVRHMMGIVEVPATTSGNTPDREARILDGKMKIEDGPMPETFRVSEKRAAQARAANAGIAAVETGARGVIGKMERLVRSDGGWQ